MNIQSSEMTGFAMRTISPIFQGEVITAGFGKIFTILNHDAGRYISALAVYKNAKVENWYPGIFCFEKPADLRVP
jgi:hypothetical protein